MPYAMERLTLAAAWAGAIGLRPDGGRLRVIGADPSRALITSGADRVIGDLACAGLWLICLWLALACSAVAAARLPGTAGAVAGSLADLVAPRLVRRALSAALGAGIAVSPAVALADPPPTPSVSVAWPLSPDSAPPPSWPVSAPMPAPMPDPATASPAAPIPPLEPGPGATQGGLRPEVTVQSGDTLWSIAASALGPGAGPADIAAAWPQWYRANLEAIGPNPNLIHPGITVHQPAQGDQ